MPCMNAFCMNAFLEDGLFRPRDKILALPLEIRLEPSEMQRFPGDQPNTAQIWLRPVPFRKTFCRPEPFHPCFSRNEAREFLHGGAGKPQRRLERPLVSMARQRGHQGRAKTVAGRGHGAGKPVAGLQKSPSNCPHGRPCAIRYDKNALEKLVQAPLIKNHFRIQSVWDLASCLCQRHFSASSGGGLRRRDGLGTGRWGFTPAALDWAALSASRLR